MEPLQSLAAFVADTTFTDLPADVVNRAQLVLRDTVGVILGGMREPEVGKLAHYAAEHHPGSVALMGHSGNVTAQWAALVHGTAGTSLEMDEGHAYARGHAAIHAVPTALALGQQHNANGKDTLTALVLGYEVAARAGIATRLRKVVHPFGAWGVLGAAAVAAKFEGMNAEAVHDVLELAASYAITPSFNTAYQGANVRNTYAGIVNQLGLLAADFYALGFRGERGGVETAFGEILGEQFDKSALTDDLGTRYEIMRGYFKPYSACRYSHAALDALFDILATDPVNPAQIAAIDVETYDIAATLNDPNPLTPLAGRFSIPHAVAAALVTGSAGPSAFTPEALHSEPIRQLAAQVKVTESPAFTDMTPAKRPARVVLHMEGGTALESLRLTSKGDPSNPMTDGELLDKFHSLANPVIGEAHAAGAVEQINTFTTLPNLSTLTKLLSGQHEKPA